jgi:uncharacterized protein
MKLDLSEVVMTPGMHGSIDIDEPCPKEAGFTCKAPLKGQVRVDNTDALLLVAGEVKTEVEFECSRCLAKFTQAVDAEIEEEFRIEKVGDSMKALPMDEDDLESAALVENNILDIDELVRQTLLVELPIAPLCKEDCKGLCPTCGENLNVRECTCPPSGPESPFQALADLMDEEQEEK